MESCRKIFQICANILLTVREMIKAIFGELRERAKFMRNPCQVTVKGATTFWKEKEGLFFGENKGGQHYFQKKNGRRRQFFEGKKEAQTFFDFKRSANFSLLYKKRAYNFS